MRRVEERQERIRSLERECKRPKREEKGIEGNLLELAVEAAKKRATLGEISDACERVKEVWEGMEDVWKGVKEYGKGWRTCGKG